ncbi:class I SAM-dependent methyltransferase [Oceanococcus atlanticus]|nr:class I SAM-dependent methyltransferase [Oceanococcus atlanticus]
MKPAALLLVMSALMPLASAQASQNAALRAAIDGEHRTASFRARDDARHPYQTLEFFGITPDMTVVELWPGGGWYSEILAPYLKPHGVLYAAHFDPETEIEYFRRSRQRYEAKLAADPQTYSQVRLSVFDPPHKLEIAPPGSADAVLTFRNVHNWYMRGGGEDKLSAAFRAMYVALKPGGILGVVDHRLPPERPFSDQDASGYMRTDLVIDVAREVGFELVDGSEINANPADTADHPKGVWTLPPSLRLGEENADYYLTIGESDRMTLKFVKPQLN